MVAVAVSKSGSKPPAVTTITCPSGYSRVNKNLNDGAAAVSRKSTAVVFCVRMVTTPSAASPLVGLTTAASAGGCDTANGWRVVLFGSTTRKRRARPSAVPGQPANLAEGTTGPAVYACVKPRAA